ncbi:hypothetical protein SAMN05428989_1782 [Pseudoxanthomonas sp. GM95]|uniref:hypothetical protein n=1 Tax=Pseudoxanthomonas sp. GM95 TaxID=1881043 RepID=UPI0008D69D62|nr:hypothetical protein [Pseudoxanthomonas sp. GM95]SEL49794.1 hypothetical protein SAMN05428989_1782 [Pseudoxanthomonas sp. GM95]
MKYRRWKHGAKFWLGTVLFVAYSALAVGVVIVDARDANLRNLSKVQLTTVASPEAKRSAGAAEVAAIYRAQSGMPFSTLPAGSTFQIVWPDGSTETLQIVDPTSSTGITPVRHSQQVVPK